MAITVLLLTGVRFLDRHRTDKHSNTATQSSDAGEVASLNDNAETGQHIQTDASDEDVATQAICDPGEETADMAFPEGLTEGERENAAAILMKSPDPQHVFAGALLTGGDGRWALRRERFGVALEANRRDPVMLSIAAAECRRQSFEGWCEENGVEALLIAADPYNGEGWAIIADRRLENGDLDEGLAAMESAAASPQANAYFAEQLGVVDRGLAAAGVGDISVRFMTAMGIAVAKVRGYRIVVKTCEDESATDYRWRSACMSFGQKLEQQARTQLDVIMGTELQRAVFAAEGDTGGLQALELRRDRLRDQMLQSAKHGFHKEMSSNVRLLSSYMNELTTKGEFAAETFLLEEQRRWIESQCGPSESSGETK